MSSNKRENQEIETIPFFPHYVLGEIIAWYVMLALLIALASLLPAGLEAKANPLQTPAHVKPEWYFLAVYQFLKVAAVFRFLGSEAPKLIGVAVPGIGVLLLLLLPFLDRRPVRHPRRRMLGMTICALTIIIFVVLTYWGQVS